MATKKGKKIENFTKSYTIYSVFVMAWNSKREGASGGAAPRPAGSKRRQNEYFK
jgi:hypothetical protein